MGHFGGAKPIAAGHLGAAPFGAPAVAGAGVGAGIGANVTEQDPMRHWNVSEHHEDGDQPLHHAVINPKAGSRSKRNLKVT